MPRQPFLYKLSLILALLITCGGTLHAQSTRSTPSTRPSDKEIEQRQQRFRQLTRQGIDLIQKGKLDDAENAIRQALALSPHSSTNLYNMACVKARQNRVDAAVDYLERAAVEGFTDFNFIARDTDLKGLHGQPRYERFLERKEEFIRKGAQLVLDWLKHEFGEGYLYEVDHENKLIFATNTDKETLAELRKSLVAQAKSQWADLFAHRPDQYISVVLPSASDYRLIVSRPGVGGFYNHDNRILIAQRLGQVMTHEFTHAMHGADIDPTGQEHPIWLAEGIATMYEGAHFEGEKLIPGENFRLPYIQKAAKDGHLISLQQLLNMDQDAFVRRATFAYGEAGSLCLYLYTHNQLRPFYDAFKAGYDKDKTGKAALEQVTGKKLADVEKEWKQWMLAQTAPPATTGPQGPVLGVRFDQANDGLRIDYLLPNGPAAKAGLKANDIIVGLNEFDVRDQQSLISLLALHQPGDIIKVKVRRGAKYLTYPLTLSRRSELPEPPRGQR